MSPNPALGPVVHGTKLECALQATESTRYYLKFLVAIYHLVRGKIHQRGLHNELSVNEFFPAPSLGVGCHPEAIMRIQLELVVTQDVVFFEASPSPG